MRRTPPRRRLATYLALLLGGCSPSPPRVVPDPPAAPSAAAEPAPLPRAALEPLRHTSSTAGLLHQLEGSEEAAAGLALTRLPSLPGEPRQWLWPGPLPSPLPEGLSLVATTTGPPAPPPWAQRLPQDVRWQAWRSTWFGEQPELVFHAARWLQAGERRAHGWLEREGRVLWEGRLVPSQPAARYPSCLPGPGWGQPGLDEQDRALLAPAQPAGAWRWQVPVEAPEPCGLSGLILTDLSGQAPPRSPWYDGLRIDGAPFSDGELLERARRARAARFLDLAERAGRSLPVEAVLSELLTGGAEGLEAALRVYPRGTPPLRRRLAARLARRSALSADAQTQLCALAPEEPSPALRGLLWEACAAHAADRADALERMREDPDPAVRERAEALLAGAAFLAPVPALSGGAGSPASPRAPAPEPAP